MMTLIEAIQARHSVRRYREEPLSEEIRKTVQDKVEQVNRESGLHVQLIVNEPKAFSGPMAYGKFSGVTNYLVMAGKKADDLDEKVGYYGEKLVLFAQQIGLNTCWAGVSYSKVPGTYELAKGEKIACYIALGYGESAGCDHKRKSISEVSNAGAETPDWFNRGVEAALLAPTAVNQQKFYIEYVGVHEEGLPEVRIKKGFSIVGYTRMDMGIAKLHFEIAASPQRFIWSQAK